MEDVEEIVPSDISIMPPDLGETLTRDELSIWFATCPPWVCSSP